MPKSNGVQINRIKYQHYIVCFFKLLDVRTPPPPPVPLPFSLLRQH